ncbi:hypothetical protein PSTT_16353 [Puccinia striiformis]|uniref:Uncharacterized protein n=1 Tax=Puccinia striiformis TaxID=27350 RepID=A0A2S4UDA7_9BASI|nr:hypothetical protein PSTT_16353 [Puccinia striiformis]
MHETEHHSVTKASDKIKVIGGLIDDSNLLKFYAYDASDYFSGSWEAFKTRMFQVALPLTGEWSCANKSTN